MVNGQVYSDNFTSFSRFRWCRRLHTNMLLIQNQRRSLTEASLYPIGMSQRRQTSLRLKKWFCRNVYRRSGRHRHLQLIFSTWKRWHSKTISYPKLAPQVFESKISNNQWNRLSNVVSEKHLGFESLQALNRVEGKLRW